MKQRAHAEVIKAWADGAQVQYRQDAGMKWADVDDPAFVADYEYRVKPAEPERAPYPTTSMSEEKIISAWYGGSNVIGHKAEVFAMLRVANAALRHAIDQGQVVTREEFDKVTAELKSSQQAFECVFGEPFRPGMIIKVKA